MRSIAISIILVGYIITIVKCEQFYEKNGALDLDGLATDIEKDNLAKRMERRAYTYVIGNTGNKRLPNYNFGLGKRAKYRSIFSIHTSMTAHKLPNNFTKFWRFIPLARTIIF